MNQKLDINYDLSSEIKPGRDPDRYSATLRAYHKILWNKVLPNNETLVLEDVYPRGYLRHESEMGKFELTSDAITHSYKNTKRMAQVLENVPDEKIESLFDRGCTIGSYIIFPKNKVKGKHSINQARGCNHKIADRFDLTLECIRLFYSAKNSPLTATFERHSDFFSLFVDFKRYVDFFLLKDLVSDDYSSIRYFLNHESFEDKPMPQNAEHYLEYRRNTLDFIESRGKRMEASLCAP
tara:strand:- start:51 stop:764 length:714 start_codon:yes stop_codon:yes gene_type:complete